MSDIPAELSLDVSSALAAVASVEAALVAAADAFQQSVSAALGSVDTTGTTIPVQVDAASITSDIDAAVAASDPTTTVTADVTADTSAAQQTIDELSGETVEVGVEADTSAAQASIDELSAHASESLAQAGEAGRAGLEVGAAGLEGSFAGAFGALKAFGPEAAGAAAAVGTLATAGGILVENAIHAESSLQRFNLVLGVSAARVRLIDVGGLNEDLKTLANRLGADDESLQNATSRFFAFGLANGTARSQVEESTKQIDALAAHAVALNPALGDVGDTVNRLTQALATGRNTADFGVSLQRSAVVAEALRENIGKTTAELTRYDLAAAGAKLATDQLGDSLATGVNAGAQNVAIQFRAVREEFRNTLEEAGLPLIQPVLALLKSLEPAAAPVAAAFAAILQNVVPLATALTGALVPALEAVTPLLNILAKAEEIVGTSASQTADKHGGFLDGLKQVVGEMSVVPFVARALNAAFGSSGDAAEAAGEQIAGAGSNLLGFVNSAFAFVAQLQPAIDANIQARDQIASKFQAGLPQIGDAFTVEAARVSTATKSIDKSSTDLIDAAKKLEDQFSAGLPSISDAFKQGISPDDLAKAKDTLESFIQGVEGVSKSAADAAQAVIDKAQAQGGTGLGGFLQQLREQTAQIAAFQGTIATLKNRGALDLAAAFADRGVESAAVAAEAAGLSDADLASAEATVEKAKAVESDAVASLGLFADQLVATFGPKGAEAGATFGQGLVDNLASPEIIAKARAEAAKLAEAAATPSGGGGAKAPQEQTLAGFLAALRSQSGDIQKFQANLDTIAQEGGTVLADTLREQGITAARAAADAAGLAPAQLQAAEQAVRDAQSILAKAQADNEKAAGDLQEFMAEAARGASQSFLENLNISVAGILAGVQAELQTQTPTLATAFSSLGALLGTDFATAVKVAAAQQLTAQALAAILPGFLGGTAPGLILPPVTAVNASFGTPPSTAVTGSTQATVTVENINVTPPRDATPDEQADAIATALAFRIQGAR